MSATDELVRYRALSYLERALVMQYALPYALAKASELYQVPAGELAELELAKMVECQKAKADRDAQMLHDAQVEAPGVDRQERDRLIAEACAAGATLEEVAGEFGITRQRVQQITGGRGAARRRAGAGAGR